MRKYVLSTRPEEKANTVDGGCFSVLNVPVTRLEPIDIDYDSVIGQDVECLAFTSSYGARLFFERASRKNFGYLGIGRSTCEEIRKNGYDCEYPERMDSEGLADLILSRCRNVKVALIRSENANEIVNERIRGRIDFIDIRNYRVVPTGIDIAAYLMDEGCLGIIVTSSMEARISIPAIRASGRPVFSIGSVTSKTLEEAGIHPTISGNSDFEDLVEKIRRYIC
ncbi:uroporphyrinogen-III synthase [Thermoplasma sp.]|uniref:uroporphyrinogen-III synthase n=1 Tax=Thermoplasma sp. TaxID=1973142 RepID=UPI0012777EFB|nr:uroporphyrinogen-III synthase [Thermoplasma sp.]KAA8923466.1 MAG: uroporphyrinogen-III synthase [Thermoplasma sp.]